MFTRVPRVGPAPQPSGEWVAPTADGHGVVVGTDGSAAAEAVVDRAAMLAVGMGVELHIVSDSDSALKSAAQRMASRPLWFELHAGNGVAPLYEVAAAVGADLIVVARTGRHPLRRVCEHLFGLRSSRIGAVRATK